MTEKINDYAKKIDEIVCSVEKETGYIFNETEVRDVFSYTVRKCEVAKKGADYIPILFENELFDYIARACINALEKEVRRARLSAQTAMA